MSVQRNSSQTILAGIIRNYIKEGVGQFHFNELLEKSKVSLPDAESFILSLFRKKVLTGTLELRCPECLMMINEYKRFSDIPEDCECQFCGSKFPRSAQYVEIVCRIVEKGFFRRRIRTAS